jgi:hypothetical protein
MKKCLKKAINSRVMLLIACLIFSMWIVTSQTEIGIAWKKELPEIVADCMYPCLFLSMLVGFFTSLILWIEESIEKSNNKFVI